MIARATQCANTLRHKLYQAGIFSFKLTIQNSEVMGWSQWVLATLALSSRDA
jgi:hypothetical protein